MSNIVRHDRLPRRFRVVGIAALASALVATVAGCGGAGATTADGKPLNTITFGISTPTMTANFVALAVGKEKGFFADEGVEVDDIFLKDSGTVLQSMASGKVDIGTPTPDVAFAAMDLGQDVKLMYNWTRRPVAAFTVLQDSPIKTVADLAGKTIGVQSRSAGTTTLAKASLKQAGIDVSQDKIVEVGLGAPALDALQRGRVDTVVQYDAQSSAQISSGAKIRLINPEGVEDLFATTFVASSAFMKSNSAAVKGFGKAWTEASVWALANPEAAIQMMWKRYPASKTGDDDAAMAGALAIFKARMDSAVNVDDVTAKKIWGQYDEAAVQHWLDFAQENGITKSKLNASDVYTNDDVAAYNDFDAATIQQAAKSNQ
ncbi:ABC transporter substrate-binding protein [Micromonospora sp. NPDC049523]|uniref:ABC transporter substrate-binding protein n=1 Tax=Micromonospora sp. NPDC049523 TaxID=3155921 RepID=UPI0034453072